jgi:hypothetical protein
MPSFQFMEEDSTGIRAIDEVTVSILDNGISGFPDDVLTFICAIGQPIGIKVQGEARLLRSAVSIFLTDGAEGDDDYTPNSIVQDVSGIGTYATISPHRMTWPPPAEMAGAVVAALLRL